MGPFFEGFRSPRVTTGGEPTCFGLKFTRENILLDAQRVVIQARPPSNIVNKRLHKCYN